MLDDLSAQIGEELSISDWLTITQDRINQFADATGDHQWIHVDPERAAIGPFGTTIAHGFLTMSLLPELVSANNLVEAKMAINYGVDRVRFISPVPVGSRVRARAVLSEIGEVSGGIQVKLDVTVEIEGSDRPACVVEWLVRFLI